MNIQDLLNALQLGEDKDWEFKSAKGGLPGSLWESYSAMANTDGGCIVLGVKESGEGEFEVQGLDSPDQLEQNFWDLANNRNKVSLNLLSNDDVQIVQVEEKQVLVIQIRRATRKERPVYVGQNPLTGTYRRYREGDYKCSQDEVGRMLADQSEQPADSLILANFGMDDLDKKSLEQYRNRFVSRSPAHPWLKESDQVLLEKLGGWRNDRQTGESGLTVAGLLMFGKDEAIRDPDGVPQYNVDYREHLSDDPDVRWTDRITLDGTWSGNVFQFYQRVITRLLADLKVPFQMGKELFRKDETIVHEAIREAFVNALVHADYRGQGGVVIQKYRDRFELSNPGTLLLSIEQILQGGISECRNKSLQLMFQQIGGGEKAGSGIDKIRQGWASQKWRWPIIQGKVQPDRVKLTLPMVSLLPEESLQRLEAVLGKNLGELDRHEVQAIVTAEVEQSVTNLRLQQFSHQHSADISRVLQGLVSKKLLVKDGYGRWASYRLSPDKFPPKVEGASSSAHSDVSSARSDVSSARNDDSSAHNDDSSAHNDVNTDDPELLEIARPAREKSRLPPEEMAKIILLLCKRRFLTLEQISLLLERNQNSIRQRHLKKLINEQVLQLRYPDEPTHPDQAYTTNIKENES